jgi:predicted nucleic acid-binding protein
VNLVVDASAAVEFLLRTRVGLRVEGVLADAAIFAPELLDVEVMAVLRRELLRGRLGNDRAGQALDDLVAWDVERVQHRELARDAWELRHNVSAYDAFYLAAARTRGAGLVTADGPLARIPMPTGVVVHDIRAG